MSGAESGPGAGDHIDFHHNFISKAVGAEYHEHHHYPPTPEPGQIVEGDIPQCPSGFQHRPQLLQQLADRLGDHAPGRSDGKGGGAVAICAMAGTPGVGKTLLAASYAWACQDARWPVVAWIAAETAEQITTGLATLADRLGQRRANDDTATAAARAKVWLAATDRPALLVFDNAADVALVRRWCPATGGTRVIITTRNRAFLRAYRPLDIGVFSPEQASAFLHQRTGLTDSNGTAALAIELGHLPLALAQAAAVIIRLRLSYPDYLELLRDFPISDYLPGHNGDAYPTGTTEAILLSITQAETSLSYAQQTLQLLSVFSPAGVPLSLLSAPDTTGIEPIHLRERLADLADTSLITFTEDGTTVLMHRLVQRVLRDRAAHRGDLHAVIGQAITLLSAFNDTLPAGAATWVARTAVGSLLEQTDALHALTSTTGIPEHLLTLRASVGQHLTDLADLTRAIPLLERTLTEQEQVLGGDHPDTLASRNNLASAYYSAGDLGRAASLLERTLAEREQVLGLNHPDTLQSRSDLGKTYEAAGDLDRAIPLYKVTLAAREQVLGGDHPDTLASRNNLASAYFNARDLDQAIPLWQQTLADRRRVLGDDHPSTLGTRNNLASAYYTAGDLDQAIPLLEQTLADYERVLGNDNPHILVSRNNLAGAYYAAGDLDRAIPLLEQTLADRRRVLGGDHPHTLLSGGNLAEVYAAAGDLDRAIPLLEQTLADCERVLADDHPLTKMVRDTLDVLSK